MHIRCCCEQDAAADRAVLYPNHYSEAPDADPALHARIRRMLDQHNAMWKGQALGVIKATHHCIDLNAGARPVCFTPRRAGHAAREAETAEVKRQLEAVVIEQTSSE